MNNWWTFDCQVTIEAEDLPQAIRKFHKHADYAPWAVEILVNRIQGVEDDEVNEAYLQWGEDE